MAAAPTSGFALSERDMLGAVPSTLATMRKTKTCLLTAIAIAGWPAAAQASGEQSSDWRFAATFYGWVSDLEGNLNTSPATQPVEVDLSYGKILDNLKFAAFGSFEARKDRLVLMSDLTYAHLGASGGLDVRDVDLLDAELDATTSTATLLAGYRVAQESVTVDLLAGGRLVYTKTELVLSGPQRTVEGEVSETWIDPLVAAQVGVPVSAKTNLTFYGDMGAGASDFTWQAIVGVQHRISSKWQLTGGWRHYSVDYDKGAFLYDVEQSGPYIGARFEF